MSRIDRVAGIAAIKHCRKPTVTASTDSVDFLHPITLQDAVTLEAFVTWTGKTSMEVFVSVTADNLFTGESRVAATSFLTFVSLDEEGHPAHCHLSIPKRKRSTIYLILEKNDPLPESSEENKASISPIRLAGNKKSNYLNGFGFEVKNCNYDTLLN